jgi:tRNA 2-thiouridine synthesizing protein A
MNDNVVNMIENCCVAAVAQHDLWLVAMSHPSTHFLDATGLLCPLPVLKARKTLLAMPPGAILELRATDPMSVIDVPHFCTEQGYALQSQESQNDVHIFRIAKP